MKPHEIRDNAVREIDWRTIIPEIGIEPLDDMQLIDWMGDVSALKMGPGVFVHRMSTWPDPYRKGAPPKYMMEDSIPDNFEGITPNGETSYAERSVASLTRSPDWNGQPVKIPKSFKNDAERMDFVKYCRMVHLYRDMVSSKGAYDSKKAEQKAHIIMALVMALFYQKCRTVGSYTIGDNTMLSEALGFAGFDLQGKHLSGKEQAKFIKETVDDLLRYGKVKPKSKEDVPSSQGWSAAYRHEADLKARLANMSQKEKDRLLLQYFKREYGG